MMHGKASLLVELGATETGLATVAIRNAETSKILAQASGPLASVEGLVRAFMTELFDLIQEEIEDDGAPTLDFDEVVSNTDTN